MLYNIKELCWDDELLKIFSIPRSMLPEVKPSASIFGYTECGILGAKIPIGGVAGVTHGARREALEVAGEDGVHPPGKFLPPKHCAREWTILATVSVPN